MRHFKFSLKRPVELARAREIYEETLRLVRLVIFYTSEFIWETNFFSIEKHVERGLLLNPLEAMPGKNMSFEVPLQSLSP